jgi:hypothetical protein
VCANFAQALGQVVEAYPEFPIVLFLGGFPQGMAARCRQGMIQGKRYLPLYPSPIVPMVAVCWPREKAQEFLAWSETFRFLPGHPVARADDAVAATWMKKTRQTFMVTIPSLVEHPDVEPSVKGGDQKNAWGKDKQRVAVLFAEDGLQYDWSMR